MALVVRLRDQDIIEIKLEDGRIINICLGIFSRFKAVAYISADKAILIKHVKRDQLEKDESDDRP